MSRFKYGMIFVFSEDFICNESFSFWYIKFSVDMLERVVYLVISPENLSRKPHNFRTFPAKLATTAGHT
jgi:hypothetical protein